MKTFGDNNTPIDLDTPMWRVQWYSRFDLDKPERPQGRHDFPTEAEARAYYNGPDVQGRPDPYWRAAILHNPGWTVVQDGDWGSGAAA